jgi:hypothetical protein
MFFVFKRHWAIGSLGVIDRGEAVQRYMGIVESGGTKLQHSLCFSGQWRVAGAFLCNHITRL